jgi:hypothetical protein
MDSQTPASAAKPTCSTPECGKEAKMKGKCQRCYQRERNRRLKAEAEAKSAAWKQKWESMSDIERMEYMRDKLQDEIDILQKQHEAETAAKQRDLAAVELTLKLLREHLADNPGDPPTG